MQNKPLIESVRALAEAQKALRPLGPILRDTTLDGDLVLAQSESPYLNLVSVAEDLIEEKTGPFDLENIRAWLGLMADLHNFDFPALLAALARAERAVQLLRRADSEIEMELGELPCSASIRAFLKGE